MLKLAAEVDALVAGSPFSGVVRVDVGDTTVVAVAQGQADRAAGRSMTMDTRFALASVTKGLTALVLVALIEDGALALDTTARSLLGDDLALIDAAVTIEHLLSHRSGIGDYLDEEAIGEITDYLMPVPVHQLDSAGAYLPILDGHRQVAAPGRTFAYNNGGYVLLALLAERASGTPFAELVDKRVARPAGTATLAVARTDEPAPGDAVHYLDATSARTNALHHPVVGIGDGGARGTADDLHRLWRAVRAGAVVGPEWVARMTTPSGAFAAGELRYGLGFWLDSAGPGVALEGYDAGISARTHHDPEHGVTWSVVSNWSDGTWPVANALPGLLAAHGLAPGDSHQG